MAKKKEAGKLQLDTLPKNPMELEQISFNLDKQDDFVNSHGICFIHYRAMPSPIGLKDRGDYRRSDSLDTISENGFVYKKYGEFKGVVMSNSKNKRPVEGGLYDYSEARLTLPRFYLEDGEEAKGERIHLVQGDRLYLKNVAKDEKDVVNYQRVEYNPNGSDYLQFPATKVEFLMDSQGNEYKEGVHFKINKEGNIQWYKAKSNPGIDPDTGKGRIYSIRYRYEAHWYVAAVINELRIGNVTTGNERKESRMGYHVMIQREYVYHNRNRGDSKDTDKKTETDRTKPEQEETINSTTYEVKVNPGAFE